MTGRRASSDAEEIMSVISDEVTENLGDDWEPTDYGQTASAVLAQFSAARVNEWPERPGDSDKLSAPARSCQGRAEAADA
jgi:hypothetical protein